MNVLPSSDVYEGDILEVVCKVESPLKNVEVYLTMDKKILKQAPVSLNHRFIASVEHSGELVCKAEWGNVQKETYHTIRVKGENFPFSRTTDFKCAVKMTVVVPLRQSCSQSQS